MAEFGQCGGKTSGKARSFLEKGTVALVFSSVGRVPFGPIMKRCLQAAVFVAGFAVAVGAAARAEDVRPASLTSFGTQQSLSAYQVSLPRLVALDAPISFSASDFAAVPS